MRLSLLGLASIVLICFCPWQQALAQQQLTAWLQALEKPRYPEYSLDKKNKLARYLTFDFSTLLKPQSEFLGFVEPDYQRLKVYFDKVVKSKKDPTVYFISGSTVVKDNRCDFSGWIKLTSIREYRSMHYGVDDEYKDKGIVEEGVTIGKFRFEEDPKQKHVGVFEGVMTMYWYLDRLGKIHYDNIESESDGYRNNQYVSTWTQYGSKKGKVANWGEYRIPFSGDLDIGAGEFSVNPKYLDNGWRGYKTP